MSKNIINTDIVFYGGRGSSSGAGGNGNHELGDTGFGHGQKGGNGKGNLRTDFPVSYINTEMKGNKRSYKDTMGKIVSLFSQSNIEFGITVDNDGFAHRFSRGDSGSVAIGTNKKDQMIIHNHPKTGWGMFSYEDLQNVAREGAKGIVAIGAQDGVVHTFTKTAKFNAVKFEKALKNAKFPKDMNYNEGGKWWLKQNAKALGFKYTEQKVSSYRKFKTKLSGKMQQLENEVLGKK